ncbi:amidase [bacterium]|nr:amidase [bacterium]
MGAGDYIDSVAYDTSFLEDAYGMSMMDEDECLPPPTCSTIEDEYVPPVLRPAYEPVVDEPIEPYVPPHEPAEASGTIAAAEEEWGFWDYVDVAATTIVVGGALVAGAALLAPVAGAALVGAGLVGAGAFVAGVGATASTIAFSAAGAATITAAGAYLTVRSAPAALESAERLATQDYPANSEHTPLDDTLNVGGWAVGAVGTAFGVSAWAQGARTFGNSLSMYQSSGMGTAAMGQALKDADAVRRFMSSTHYAAEMASHPRFAGNLSTMHAGLARVWDPLSKTLLPIELTRLGSYLYSAATDEDSQVSVGQMLFSAATVSLLSLAHLEPLLMKNAANRSMMSQTGSNPAVNGDFTAEQILADATRHAAGEESLAVERARRAIGTLPEEHPVLPEDASTHARTVAALDAERYLPTRANHRAGLERTLDANDTMHAEARAKLDSGELDTVDTITGGKKEPNKLTTPITRIPNTSAAQQMKTYLERNGYRNFEELLASEPNVALDFINRQFTTDDLIWAFNPQNGINGQRLMRCETQIDVMLRDPDFANNSIYTRNTQADVTHYRSVAREADSLWDSGRPVYFEVGGQKETITGLLVGSKDLVVTSVPKDGFAGYTTMGSMGPGLASDEVSFFSRRVGELGAIEVPIGAVTAGNGGTAKDVRGRYIPNPSPASEQVVEIDGVIYRGTDIGGSSSPTVYLVKSSTSPIKVASGSDTGGSIHAPASLVSGVGSYIPPVDGIPRQGVVHYSLTDDHIGMMAQDAETAFRVAQGISATSSVPAPTLTPYVPRIAYVKKDFEMQEPAVRDALYARVDALRAQGFEVVELSDDLHSAIIGDFQGSIYGPKTRSQVLWTLMNPTQNAGSWIPEWVPQPVQTGVRNMLEPPRVGIRLDENLEVRLRKAQEEYAYYPRVMQQDATNNALIDEILGEGTVLLRAQPQRVPTAMLMDREPYLDLVGVSPRRTHLVDHSEVGALLDRHDYETMVFDSMRGWAGRVEASEPNTIGQGVLVFGKPNDVYTFDQLQKAGEQSVLSYSPGSFLWGANVPSTSQAVSAK